MISLAELAAMQTVANSAGDLSIAIHRLSMSQDGAGNVIRSWTLTSTVLGNLAQPTASQLQNYGYAIADLATWQVRLPVGTSVQQGDQLVVGTQTLEVQVILAPQSYQTSMRVLAAEVKRV